MTVSTGQPLRASNPRSAPAWVAVLEVICLLAIAIELVVVFSGGFRWWFAGSRLSVRSPVRPLLWAAIAAGVRFAAARTTPIQLPRLIERWSGPQAVRSAFAVMLGTRPAILLVGYLAVIMFGYPEGAPPYRVSSSEWVNLPVRWDTGWYLTIVTDGYGIDMRDPAGQQNIVFFPAYPLIVRTVGSVLGGQLTSDILAGELVSFVAFFGALIYLYALARQSLDDERALGALWLLAAYPFAVFFGAMYTESLFLLCATGAFYHFTRREFGWASMWGLLIGLTRPPGCLLSIPLALLAFEAWLPPILVGGAAVQRSSTRPTWTAILAAATPGIGMLIYAAYIWRLVGDPLAWAAGHAAWGRSYQGLGMLIIDHYKYIANSGFAGYVRTLPQDMLNGLGALFVLIAAWPVAKRLGIAYAAFILVNILPPLAAGGLLSAGRFSAVLFPAFIWFAGAVPSRHRAGWIATFASLQALVAGLFYTWRNLY